VVCATPSRYLPKAHAELAQEIWGDPARLIPIPRIQIRFEVAAELDNKPFLDGLQSTIQARGLIEPGVEYMLCCDETYFWQHVLDRSVVDRNLRLLRVPPSAWPPGGLGGLALWSVSQPVVGPAQWVAQKTIESFPATTEFIETVTRFAGDHPYLTMGIVVTGIVITAGVAAYLAPEIIGSALVAEAGSVIASDGIGAVAMTDAVVAETATADVASVTAAQAAGSAAQVAGQLTGGAAGAQVISLAQVLAEREAMATAARTVKGISAAAAAVLAFSVKRAYANPAASPASDGSSGSPLPVAMDFGKLFMLPKPAVTLPDVKFPGKYDQFNLLDFTVPDLTQLNTVPVRPGVRPTVMARYLGKITSTWSA
jgi:hypothetical protein